jgi:hypothetical protein
MLSAVILISIIISFALKRDLEQETAEFKQMLQDKRINAFYKNAIVDSYLSGQMIASQIHGMGDFRHNTILLDWHETMNGKWQKAYAEKNDQLKLIRFYNDLKNSLLLLNINHNIQRSNYRKIDVWWDPGQKNGSFMLLLAHLLASSTFYENPDLTIKTIVLKDNMEQTHALLEELLIKSRIKARIDVLYPDAIQELSLSIEFDRFQRKRARQKKWISAVRRIVNIVDKEQEETGHREPSAELSTGESKIINEDLSDFEKKPGDDDIKEKLSVDSFPGVCRLDFDITDSFITLSSSPKQTPERAFTADGIFMSMG